MFEIINKILNKVLTTISSLPENEIFIGLVFTGLISVTLYLLRNLPKAIFKIIKNNFSVQITFDEVTTRRVLNYIDSLPPIIGPKSYDVSINKTDLDKRLGSGHHIRRYKGKLLYSKVDINYSEMSGNHYVILDVSIFTRNRSIIDDFLNDVYKSYFKGDIKILTSDSYMWRLQKTTTSRSLNTLFYPDNLKEDIISDLKQWKDSKELYERLGIPYRRGYLFYGEPGTGKSSIIPCLSEYLNKNIYYLDPSSIDDNKELLELFSDIKPGSILVVEDIDVSLGFKKRKENEDNVNYNTSQSIKSNKNSSGLTFSGLLNIFDGLVSCEDFVVIFTTNHPNNIDPALLREGRIDKKFEFKYLDFESLKEMVNFYELNIDESELEKWLPISPAKAQNKLIKIKTNSILN